MGQFYNITNANKVDTWRSRYATGDGDDMQDWFIEAEGVDKPIKQTTKMESPTPSGQTYGVMEVTMSKKGTEYYKFKRQEAPDGIVKPPETVLPTNEGSGIMQEVLELTQANNVLLKMLSGEEPEERGDDSAKDEVVLDDIEDKPVDLSDIPF